MVNLDEHKKVLKQALDRAIQKGCYSIDEVDTILTSFKYILELDDVKFGKLEMFPKDNNINNE